MVKSGTTVDESKHLGRGRDVWFPIGCTHGPDMIRKRIGSSRVVKLIDCELVLQCVPTRPELFKT